MSEQVLHEILMARIHIRFALGKCTDDWDIRELLLRTDVRLEMAEDLLSIPIEEPEDE